MYFAVDADPELIQFAAEKSDGIVIAGAGAGEFSEEFKNVIKDISIPIVISSRTNDGIILRENLLCDNTIAGGNLNPQKAAILLRLALLENKDIAGLQEIFNRY